MFKVSQLKNQNEISKNEYYEILSNENNINEEIKNPKFLITQSNKEIIENKKKKELKKIQMEDGVKKNIINLEKE